MRSQHPAVCPSSPRRVDEASRRGGGIPRAAIDRWLLRFPPRGPWFQSSRGWVERMFRMPRNPLWESRLEIDAAYSGGNQTVSCRRGERVRFEYDKARAVPMVV